MRAEDKQSILDELLICLKDGGYDSMTLQPVEMLINELEEEKQELFDVAAEIAKNNADHRRKQASEIKQKEEDIDFLCTWCEYTTLDEDDPHLQHHQDIIKRWKESNERHK